MRKLAAMAGIVAVGLGTQTTAFGYGATAAVNFSWSTNATEIVWRAAGPNTLTAMTNGTYFSSLTGNSETNYYNADFATAAQCASIVAGLGGFAPQTRKYGCRYLDSSTLGTPVFAGTPLPTVGAGNLGPGAQAAGTITVTDTTLTGTLTILATTDEPTGGTAASIGTGSNGYNLRSVDGTPFGNLWYGVTTLGTYTLNLTGTFTATSWQVTGGGAAFSDAGFFCQQGGFSAPANLLCTASTSPGGYTGTGGALSWGWDLDGSGAGTVVAGIDVRGTSNALITTLSGVLADLSVDGLGNITTNSAEIRRALGASLGCGLGPTTQNITYDAALTRVSCGALTAAGLTVSGVATVVPVPAAVWLFGSALGLLGVARRRYPPSEQPVQPVTF